MEIFSNRYVQFKNFFLKFWKIIETLRVLDMFFYKKIAVSKLNNLPGDWINIVLRL